MRTISLRNRIALPIHILAAATILRRAPATTVHPGIVWAYVRYLAELDELGRLLQLQALAFSYGAVMTLAAARLGLAVGGFTFDLPMNPSAVFGWLLIAEALRGVVLVYLARKRR